MDNSGKEFYAGAMWAASTIYRMHTDSVIVKELLDEIPDLHETAQNSAEYDIHPLRLFVINSLPLGHDATYKAIGYGPMNSRGELICDHKDAENLSDSDYESYCVYAVEGDDSTKVLVMSGPEEAEELAETLARQLQRIAESHSFEHKPQ